MVSPFPGMNPYLENPDLWSEVHHRLITAIADHIESHLSQKYRVAIEKRTYMSSGEDAVLIGIPDVSLVSTRTKTTNTPSVSQTQTAVMIRPPRTEAIAVTLPIPEEIREAYLEIREIKSGKVITVIEILSPTNKRKGEGLEAYLNKRQQVLKSQTHLVEIDLLRKGKKMPILSEIPKTDYCILIARANRRPRGELYAFNIRDEIPNFSIPLQLGDEEPEVNLQSLLMAIYERARFDLTLDYHQEPIPNLQEKDRIWVDSLLHEMGRR